MCPLVAMVFNKSFLLTALLLISDLISTTVSLENPEDFANPLSGTFTDGQSYSTGNTLPLIGRPWGFNHWAPQSTAQNHRSSSWWFSGNDHSLHWLRCTHQPSPWIGDWGWFLFMPQVGSYTDNPNFWWQPRGSIIKPHLFDATLAPHGLRVELVPTDHAAALRVTFPLNTNHAEKRVCFREGNWASKSELMGSTYIVGRATQVNMDRMHFNNFNLFIATKTLQSASVESNNGAMCYRYKDDESTVIVHIATSLISPEQAKFNLDSETKDKTFDELKEETRLVWNRLLNRVDIVDPGPITGDITKYLITFYTGLYRALMFPRRLDETDHKTGELVHFSPYDSNGGVHKGPLVTDNGFWDTFRTVYPLLGLAYRGELGFIVQGWLNAYREGGWLPSWASPGYRNCMVGTYADVVVSDAIIKDIKGFDLETARAALKKDAFEDPPGYAGSAVGKEGLREYSQHGYMAAAGNTESVSRSLDFGFADYATARAFEYLSQDEDYLTLSDNRLHVSELKEDQAKLDSRWQRAVEGCFSRSHGLMAPKSRDGNVVRNFDPVEWGNGFVEGNSWHHSFPPYALKKLSQLYGNDQKLLQKLHELMSTTSDFRVGSYHQEIHEMTEMRTLAMGQYGHNNQPSHHILYLFAQLGDVSSTEQYVREVINRGYGVDFYAGDEDNGEMGAWFVLSALGLFSTTPGTPDYVLTSPLFKHVVIHRSNEPHFTASGSSSSITGSEDFHIIARNAAPLNIHSTKILLNGEVVTTATLSDRVIQPGGVLQFFLETEMSQSNTKAEAEAEAVVTIKEAREIFQQERAGKGGTGRGEAEAAAAAEKRDALQKEIEKQKRLVSSLSNELAVHLQEHHSAPEYLKMIRSAEAAVATAAVLPDSGEPEPCASSSLTQLELGLGFVAVNLCIIALMLGIQLARRGSSGDPNGSPSAVGGSVGEALRWLTCCCNPVLISQCLVSVCGINTVQSFVGKPSKRDTYTV